MNAKELRKHLSKYPDDTPILITIDTPRDGLFVSSIIEFMSVSNEAETKVKYIELIGTIED